MRANTHRGKLLAAFGYAHRNRVRYILDRAVGAWSDEQAARHAGLLGTEYATRCSELRSAGLIQMVDGVTRKGSSGMCRVVSQITEEGLRLLEELEKH